MKLTRLRLEQFKQFRQPLEIDGLAPGLNLFTGPNEAGKSTVVAAIRAAFFERHRSASVDELRPWGESTAAPTVELEFELGGRPYRLVKSFLHKKRCELQCGSQRLDGAEAEDHLAALLGFRHAGRGASQAEHWGIPGLLWIAQGSAHDIRDPVAHATDHLRRALDASLGEIASSGGDEVLAKVEAARNELLTPSGGAPRGSYAEALRLDTALAARLADTDAAIAAYRRQVDSLAMLRREHAADEAAQPWLDCRAREQEAAARLAAITDIERELAAARQQAGHFDERLGLLRSRLDGFAREDDEARQRHAALAAASQRADAARRQHDHWQARHAAAGATFEAARQTLRVARQEDTRRSLASQLATLRQQAADSAARLADADARQAGLRELQRQAATTGIADADLTTLREQQRHLDEIRIRQAAAATRLHFALADGRTLQIGAETVAGSGERRLVDATTLVLPGLGELTVAPGGADLAALRDAAAELAERRADLLQRLGLASLDEAEARHRAAQLLAGDIKAASAGLASLAPRGLDALRAERDAHEARAADTAQAIARLPPPPDAAPPAVAAAEGAEDAARHAVEQISGQLAQARSAAANVDAACAAARREAAGAQALVDDPARAGRLAAARAGLTDALAQQAGATARIDALTRQIDAARPDFLQQDVERYRCSAEQHEKRFAERRDSLLRLDVELQAAGALGLDEQRAEIERDLAQARRRSAELQRRAAALDHLLSLLKTRRHSLTLRLQAPLQKHLNRYLQLLFPGASLAIDDALSPAALTRSGSHGAEAGDFEALSFGAREQMGVISRLAYADLLQEAGRPTLVILDDALVHSDAERLAQMKRILFDAARRHQILLFSCHPENWRDLGVAARSLRGDAALALPPPPPP